MVLISQERITKVVEVGRVRFSVPRSALSSNRELQLTPNPKYRTSSTIVGYR